MPWRRGRPGRGLALLAVSGLLGLSGVIAGTALPAGASTFSVTLTATKTTLPTGSATTLTATSNMSVSSPSPYFIEIFDVTTGVLVTTPPCGQGSVCPVTISQTVAGTHEYVAYVALSGNSNPPPSIQATSAAKDYVTWTNDGFQLSLSGPAGTPFGLGGTYTAATNVSITGQGDTIQIDDETTGKALKDCPSSPCSVSFKPSFNGDFLVAFLDSNAIQPVTSPFSPLASSNVLFTFQHQLT